MLNLLNFVQLRHRWSFTEIIKHMEVNLFQEQQTAIWLNESYALFH